MKYKNLQEKIENINLDDLSEDDILHIEQTIKELDNGNIRVVNNENGEWSLNEWVRDAILLFFSIKNLKEISANDLIYYDKLEPKKNYKDLGIRVVPPGVVRYGAFCEPGVVVMPGFVNIGAYVGSGTMVDTWATVGSCAQIGKNVHLSGGAGIGGVLEPLQAGPVIIEDDCFIGARSEVVEGVVVEQVRLPDRPRLGRRRPRRCRYRHHRSAQSRLQVPALPLQQRPEYLRRGR